jgi:hypothetical protein
MPIDVNAIHTEPLLAEEQKKLMKEGHCSHCKKQGHMSCQCPQKKKKLSEESKEKTHTMV